MPVRIVRRDMQIGNAGRNQAAVSFGQRDGRYRRHRIFTHSLSTVDTDSTITLHTHIHNERIVFVKFTMKTTVYFQ